MTEEVGMSYSEFRNLAVPGTSAIIRTKSGEKVPVTVKKVCSSAVEFTDGRTLESLGGHGVCLGSLPIEDIVPL
ncbi:MAG: hypothetical protein COT81_03350 [Candidatus Buchananbacteria bacterium CG10_big_fil_rev_8_21_14_0_10_42_9]|uniref:Uncharacterized protein n=1 Tax=Candidatus Buchananbacteria bacterium CG10_big_fil_rev_8_21_14_0_10_42_9 TaxID=1974526 RepID=A0A2H0W0X6_9BACT|nr:MAG: hypothetical protein COT81_03350 [Candidatus Buchananbacteria bacterium CG10_big_fil_rev_8_21_14_0_10_42_9]